MSRISSVIVLAMLVLTGAMGLKTVVTTHGDSSVLMANGTAPIPPVPCTESNGASSAVGCVVTTHADSSVLMANGTAPIPPVPCTESNGASSAVGCAERNGQATAL